MQIRNANGELLDYSYQTSENRKDSDWLFIVGHGVTGNKDRPIVKAAAKAISEIGYDTLVFSFSGNGHSEGHFQDSNITKEVDDLGSVLDAFAKRKIAYIGHSMGAAVGVIKAASDQRIQLLVSLAGMVDTRKFAQTEFGDAKPDQDLMWEERGCPLSSSFMTDLCETVVSVTKTARKIDIPWLLLHGSA
ncbi:MAG: alpha/beta fold hydrolase, partial [Verrucomicrobiota bacterium]